MKTLLSLFRSQPLALRVAAVVGLALCVVFFVPLFEAFRGNPGMHRPPHLPNKPWGKPLVPPANESDIQAIRPWMTFAFLMQRFSIPAERLAQEFSITEKQFPKITIQEHAQNMQVSPQVLVSRIQEFIRASMADAAL